MGIVRGVEMPQRKAPKVDPIPLLSPPRPYMSLSKVPHFNRRRVLLPSKYATEDLTGL
jgi:hypothetical protein